MLALMRLCYARQFFSFLLLLCCFFIITTPRSFANDVTQEMIYSKARNASSKIKNNPLESKAILESCLLDCDKMSPGDKMELCKVGVLKALSVVYAHIGFFDEAIVAIRQAISLASNGCPGCNKDIQAQTLSELASIYYDMGYSNMAEKEYLASIDLIESLDSITLDYVDIYLSLSDVYSNKGLCDKAQSLYTKASRAYNKVPHEYINVNGPAFMLARSAQVDICKADYLSALNKISKAEEMIGNASDFWRLMLMISRAHLHTKIKEFTKAEEIFIFAYEQYKRRYGQQSYFTGSVAGLLGNFYFVSKQFDKAIAYTQEAESSMKRTFGGAHPDNVEYQIRLAYLHGVLAQYEQSLERFLDGIDAQHAMHINTNILSNDYRDKYSKKVNSEYGLHGLLSLVYYKFQDNPRAIQKALDLTLLTKSILLDADRKQHELILKNLQNEDGEDIKQWNILRVKYSSLSKLYLTQGSDAELGDFNIRYEAIKKDIDELSLRLFNKSIFIKQARNESMANTKFVSEKLSKNTALIEIIKYKEYDWARGEWPGLYRYIAFILHSDGKVDFVNLGNAEIIEKDTKEIVRIFYKAGKGQNAAAAKLYDMIWKKVLPYIKDITHIIVSPDGILNLVPLEIALAPDEKYIVESYFIRYVSSGREIMRNHFSREGKLKVAIIANPLFDSTIEDSNYEKNLCANSRAPMLYDNVLVNLNDNDQEDALKNISITRSSLIKLLKFSPLPCTQIEAEEIRLKVQGDVEMLVKDKAVEEYVTTSRSHNNIMHIATHGFFIDNDTKDEVKYTQGIMNPFDRVLNLPNYESALFRSGLAFANANLPASNDSNHDGLLTAYEVAGADLSGTELVVLSACVTGIGDVLNGESVFGLRRAFTMAGAENLIMSMWNAPDNETRLQMSEFYDYYIKGGYSASEALTLVKRKSIERYRKKWGTAPPWDWGTFIFYGMDTKNIH